MSRYLVTISNDTDRQRAARWAMAAKEGMRIEFKQAKRSGEQNDKMWAMLTEVAAQVPWHGIRLAPDDWKFLFLDALKRELRMVPNLDGNGFVNLGRSSSDLSTAEMSELIELIHAFGANHGVTFKEDSPHQMPPSDAADGPQTESRSPASSAGNNSEPSAPTHPADEEKQASDASPAGLPSGWSLVYAAALRRAQKPESLKKYAAQFWSQYGGFEAHKNGPDGPTAIAIYDAFTTNFGRPELIEAALRELI